MSKFPSLLHRAMFGTVLVMILLVASLWTEVREASSVVMEDAMLPQLPPISTSHDDGVPNIIHFIHGLKPDPKFTLLHYIAIKSAFMVHKPEAIYFYHVYKPTGKWWDRSQKYITLVQVQPVESVFGNKLVEAAHMADIVRMQAILKYGGIYMDMDVISFHPFPAEYYSKTPGLTLGEEGFGGAFGLCNAVIIATPGHSFMTDWLNSYRDFQSTEWAEHSVHLPKKMWLEDPERIRVVHHSRFFYPTWEPHGVQLAHNSTSWVFGGESFVDGDGRRMYKQLLWHAWHHIAEEYLKDLTVAKILERQTSFTRGVARFVEGELD
ncbi:hypothetical protein BC831DRAFT_512775 [Entophlyctis helioformis]|nr:hypothetical protein BC831DRAFT_512775 [Entophlyctis helioformis]